MLSNRESGMNRTILYRWVAIASLLLAGFGFVGVQTAPAPSGSQGQTASPQTPAPSQPGQSSPIQTTPSQPQPPVQPAPTPPKPLVMIDPAHGGSESGAILNPAILEKDVTLVLARRLRLDLGARGFVAELVRDSDVNLSIDDRVAKANAEHPALYVCLHATSETGGLRVYAAMLAEGADGHGPFTDWDTAQFPSLASSRAAQQVIAAAIQKSGISARALVAPLRPLNNVTSPAVALELAPSKADVSQLVSAAYQQTVSAALANGIAEVLSTPGTSLGASK